MTRPDDTKTSDVGREVDADGERSGPWRCFHCDELFTDEADARDHFGIQEDGVADEVACQLTKDEKGLVGLLREAHEELRKYHTQENASYREFHALGAKHSTELRRVEEEGYAKGLADGRALTATPPPPSSESTAPASSEVSRSPSGISRDPGEPDDAA